MKIGVVVGNPRAGSRTLEAATRVAERLAGRPADLIVDLAEVGPALLEAADPAGPDTVASVCEMDLLVVASPTYKATYTGLLKVFLDLFPPGALQGTTALAVMLGAGLRHSLAGELHLKPVLVELGAVCPLPALYILDSDYQHPADAEWWVASARRYLADTRMC